MRAAVLVSGRGSNLRAIVEAIERGRCAARIVGVVTDRPKAGALELARSASLATRIVRPRDHESRSLWDEALALTVAKLSSDLVVLAGFMRIVGAPLLNRFPNGIINVHPSLLPSFPGKDAPQQAIDAGVRISGCTVHLVDSGVDCGPILAQAAVPVRAGDDAASLHKRIQAVEHTLLPAVIDALARGVSPALVGDSVAENR